MRKIFQAADRRSDRAMTPAAGADAATRERATRKRPRSSDRRWRRPPPLLNFFVIPLAFASSAAFAVSLIGFLDRLPGFRREALAALPWSDVAQYAAVTFAAAFVLLVVKALMWPWR